MDGAPRLARSFTGWGIVRLTPDIASPSAGNLPDLCLDVGLTDLAALLESQGVARSQRLILSLPPDEVARLEADAWGKAKGWRSLNAYWRLDLRGIRASHEVTCLRLNLTPGVDLAYLERAPSSATAFSATPTVASREGDDPARTAIDVPPARPGSRGEGVGLVDVGAGWNRTHAAIRAARPRTVCGVDAGSAWREQGTAALGLVAGRATPSSAEGIAPALAPLRLASIFDGAAFGVANAIVAATQQMPAGDVMLVGLERDGLPTEIDPGDFDAIRLAVAAGIVVVEAAGNGGVNLDGILDEAGVPVLRRGQPGVPDSGAVLVAGSGAASEGSLRSPSNFGSRIDCWAAGQGIRTCGEGMAKGGADPDLWYSDAAHGTGIAAAVVAGHAVLLQALHLARTGKRLAPDACRRMLARKETVGGVGDRPPVARGVPDLRPVPAWNPRLADGSSPLRDPARRPA